MPKKRKDPIAVELGRRGGSHKVPKGTAMLNPEERRERALNANKARWGKRKRKKAA